MSADDVNDVRPTFAIKADKHEGGNIPFLEITLFGLSHEQVQACKRAAEGLKDLRDAGDIGGGGAKATLIFKTHSTDTATAFYHKLKAQGLGFDWDILIASDIRNAGEEMLGLGGKAAV